ncbi:MAG TPA: CARDB domain-containing protein, partial [Candidatus Paceibacterota bacterium]
MNKQIKLFAVLSIVVVLGVSLFVTSPVSAQTNEQIIQQLQEQIMQLKAQITALQRQLSGVTPSETEPVPATVPVSSVCPEFSQSLYPGVSDASTGGEVTKLQKMLANDPNVYPERLVTGYYGSLTEKAVQRWQTKQGVVSSGSPATTGYGVVGPQTRAQIITACPTQPPVPVNVGYLYITPSSASMTVGESKSFQAYYQPPMPPCPSGAFCAQVMPARIPVAAEWTSSNSSVASVLVKEINCTSGACPISVKGNSNGTADIKAAYRPSYGDGREIMMAAITATAKVTVGSGSSDPSITVFSPNGGETWTKDTTQTIKWQDNTPIPICPVGAACAPQAPQYFDIKLLPYYPPCTTNLCPAYYPSPYTIAKSVYGSSYSWSVGKYLDVLGTGTGGTAPDGSYTVQVCQTGTDICDSSNATFTITGSTQVAPTSSVSFPQQGRVTIAWNAYGFRPGNASYVCLWRPSVGETYATANCSGTNGKYQTGLSGSNTFSGILPNTYYSYTLMGTNCIGSPSASTCTGDYGIQINYSFQSPTWAPSNSPNLTAEIIGFPGGTPVANMPFTVKYIIKNIGQTAALATRAGFGIVNVETGQIYSIGVYDNVGPLASGASQTITHQFSGFPAGSYAFSVGADATILVNETNEQDNRSEVNLTLGNLTSPFVFNASPLTISSSGTVNFNMAAGGVYRYTLTLYCITSASVIAGNGEEWCGTTQTLPPS